MISLKNGLRFLLAVSIITFFVLLNQQAQALKLNAEQLQQLRKIYKPDLPKASLEERIQWLQKSLGPRLESFSKYLSLKDKSTQITLVVYKKERVLELWKRGTKNTFIKSYDFTASSGVLGPKNKQGDNQIPEGIYRASVLNPNSQYYLSIGINYPNENDRKRGAQGGIKNLGGDIFIHGRFSTVGCVPVGDHSIEELFYVVSQVGLMNTRVVMAPSRLPFPTLTAMGLDEGNALLREKYASLTEELTHYPASTANQ